jgi:anhydro-N-acetylmuramic acid kinase
MKTSRMRQHKIFIAIFLGNKVSTLALGLMSGTSMDGIDVVIMNPLTHELIHGETIPYSNHIADKLKKVMDGQEFNMHFFAHLNREVGQAFAKAAKKALHHISPELSKNVIVIGNHGQTICHHIVNSVPYTWQIGCPNTILEECRIPVVYDFRSKNVAQGGQGAPLAPLYHQELFLKEHDVAVINIGGISNISLLSQNKPPIGFDIGPGNCLMDAWIDKHRHLKFDKDGEWAATGAISNYLLQSLLKEPFVSLPYPKSIGKEYYSLTWLNDYLYGHHYSPEDVQATLMAFTAKSIAKKVKELLPLGAKALICGGGAQNSLLLRMIQFYLPAHTVQTTDEYGIASDYLEAMMVAWLAYKRLNVHKFNVSSIMGGRDQQTIGIICN